MVRSKEYNNEHYQKYKEYYKGYSKEYQKQLYKDNKEVVLERNKKYYQENKERMNEISRQYYQKNKETILKSGRTTKGRIQSLKHYNKRKRELGFEVLFDNPFPSDIEINWHHISDTFVVALPVSLHTNHLGKNHREELKPYVESIYDISYIIVE